MNTIRLKFFSFSLKYKSKIWLQKLRSESIITWDDLQEQFLKKKFPPIELIFLKEELPLSHKSQGKHFTNVGEDLKKC